LTSLQSIYYCGQADARLKEKKEFLVVTAETFSNTTTCSGNSHPFHRALCPSGYASTVRDKLTGIEFTLATVNPSGVQFLGHGEADLAINVFRTNKRKAAWFVTRYLPSTIRGKQRSVRLTRREIDWSWFGCLSLRDFIGWFLSMIRHWKHARITRLSDWIQIISDCLTLIVVYI